MALARAALNTASNRGSPRGSDSHLVWPLALSGSLKLMLSSSSGGENFDRSILNVINRFVRSPPKFFFSSPNVFYELFTRWLCEINSLIGDVPCAVPGYIIDISTVPERGMKCVEIEIFKSNYVEKITRFRNAV